MATLKPEHMAMLEKATETGGLAQTTSANYRSLWRMFGRWLAVEYPGVEPLEADVGLVAVYLMSEHRRGSAASTLTVRLRAINHHRERAGLEPYRPAENETLRGVLHHAQTTGRGVRKMHPLRRAEVDRICDMLAHRANCGRIDGRKARGNVIYTRWPHEPGPRCRERRVSRGQRRRALRTLAYVRLGFGCGLRVSEAIALRWSDIAEHPDHPGAGMLTIRRSKTDQRGEGATATIPPEAMKALATYRGDLWRKADRPRREPGASVFGWTTARAYRNAIRDAARDAGIPDWRKVGTHSLRRGGATELSASGYSLVTVKRYGRWRSDKVAAGYCNEGEAEHRDASIGILG